MKRRWHLILWGVGLSLAAAVGYVGYALSQIAPVGTGYAAQILCTGVFVSGRPAAAVIEEDIMAGVHPLLTVVRTSVDRDRQRTRATFLGLARREAQFRPGFGCTLAIGVSPDELLARSGVGSAPPPLQLSTHWCPARPLPASMR